MEALARAGLAEVSLSHQSQPANSSFPLLLPTLEQVHKKKFVKQIEVNTLQPRPRRTSWTQWEDPHSGGHLTHPCSSRCSARKATCVARSWGVSALLRPAHPGVSPERLATPNASLNETPSSQNSIQFLFCFFHTTTPPNQAISARHIASSLLDNLHPQIQSVLGKPLIQNASKQQHGARYV